MKDWKYICKKLFILPLWLVIILAAASAVALIFVFMNDMTATPPAYVIYVFSFYSLTAMCTACVKTLPRYYRGIKRKVYNNKYAKRYLTEAVYKTHVNLYISLMVNLFYAATNAAFAVRYRSVWFGTFGIYYGIMATMHFLLVSYVGKNQIGESRLGELKRARACVYVLLTVNVTLSGVVLMMAYQNKGFSYRGFLIYVMAVYTFYITTAAVIDLVKYRKYNSPVMSVSKLIKLASSLFSMLFLETAMFSQFGQDTSDSTKRIMIMATGAGICVIVVGAAVYVQLRTSGEIREYKMKRSRENYAESE